MAQTLDLKQKSGVGGGGVFKIFNEYLQQQTTSSTAAAATARSVRQLAPTTDGKEADNFVWDLCNTLLAVAEQIPHDHPAQDRLVNVLRELTLLTGTAVKVQGGQLWTDLPMLGLSIREYLNGPRTSNNPEEQVEIYKCWVNFHAFAARLNGAAVTQIESTPLWMLRSGLEKDQSRDPQLHDCHVMTAAQIIEYNGPILVEKLRSARKLSDTEERMYKGGSLFRGKSGFHPERWAFWINRFREEAAKSESEDVKAAALRAARLMEIWRGGGEVSV